MPKADTIRSRRKRVRKQRRARPLYDELWLGELGGDALKSWHEDRTYGTPPPPPSTGSKYRKRT